MKITGTLEAFAHMLTERGVYSTLGVSRATVSNWKRALDGTDPRNMPTIDKMEEMLLKYGATIVREKVWDLKI